MYTEYNILIMFQCLHLKQHIALTCIVTDYHALNVSFFVCLFVSKLENITSPWLNG